FLMAADAMLKADLVTNVFLDRLGLQYNSRIDLQTNYTVGGSYFDDPSENAIDPHRTEGNITTARVIVNTPVRPDISVTNIQIFHVPNTNSALWAYTDLTYTNA